MNIIDIQEIVRQTFATYAYSPYLVYGAICLFMLMSGFGLPIPEEVILVSAGFVGYTALNPDLFPPPYPGATPVNVYVLASVAFFAVIGADYFIYFLGKVFGPKLFKLRFFKRLVSDKALDKIQRWTKKYGYWAVLIFRFTPGVRFPGHLMCGAMGLSPWKFVGVDAIAAGFSVPTQVLLVAFYGEYILQYFGQFKIYFFGTLAAAFLIFLAYRYIQSKKELKDPVV